MLGRLISYKNKVWTLSEIADDVASISKGKIRCYKLQYGIHVDVAAFVRGLNRTAGTVRYQAHSFWFDATYIVMINLEAPPKRRRFTPNLRKGVRFIAIRRIARRWRRHR